MPPPIPIKDFYLQAIIPCLYLLYHRHLVLKQDPPNLCFPVSVVENVKMCGDVPEIVYSLHSHHLYLREANVTTERVEKNNR